MPASAREGGRPGVQIGRLEWSGVAAVKRADLARRILSTGASWRPWLKDPPFDEATLEDDLHRITDFYRSRGYYRAAADYTLEWNEKRTRVDVLFSVTEGIPVVLTSLEILGLDDFPDAVARQLSAGLPLARNRVFRADHYVASKQELLLRLANRGFPEARLEGTGEVGLETLTARVNWRVEAGPRVDLGPIRITGLEAVAEELVRRELVIAPGQRYSQAKLRQSEVAIYALGLFSSVAVTASAAKSDAESNAAKASGIRSGRASEIASDNKGKLWPVEVRVRERKPRSLRISAGYGTEDKFRSRVRVLHRNFLGGARTLSVGAKYSSLVLGASSRLTQPHFLDPQTELELDLSFVRETPPAYDSNLVVVRAELRRRLGELWVVRTGFFFERGDVTRVESGDPSEEGVSQLSLLEFGFRRSTVNDLLDTRTGSYLDLSLKPALEVLGSDVNYVKLEGVAHWFHPLWSFSEWQPVFALRVHAGVIQPFGGSGDADVPVFRRFYSGGANTVRGFEYQHLGPADAQGEPQGGLTVAELNLEVRFPIWRMLSGVVFSDTGQVARDPFSLSLADFRTSLGGGARIKTPVGDLRFDYGRLLNPPAGVARGRFYISVGQAF